MLSDKNKDITQMVEKTRCYPNLTTAFWSVTGLAICIPLYLLENNYLVAQRI